MVHEGSFGRDLLPRPEHKRPDAIRVPEAHDTNAVYHSLLQHDQREESVSEEVTQEIEAAVGATSRL